MDVGSLRWRSALFAPATRVELVAKLAASEADAVILDLEDAVSPERKEEARGLARRSAEVLLATPNAPAVAIRVNGTASRWFAGDMAEALPDGLDAVVVPMVESAEDVAMVAAARPADGPAVVAGIETALGVADARAILVGPVRACYFGAEDFVADMGGVRTTAGDEVRVARAMVAMAARVARVSALDMVVADFAAADQFAREATEARGLGYAGKLCIHPSQVAPANAAFVPSEAEVARALRLLMAFEEARIQGRGAFAFEGQMVDEPLAAQARAVIARAGGGPR